MNIDKMKLKTDERAIFALRELYGKYGYSQYKMSKFEEYDLYVRNKNFLISDNIITFTDTNGKLMALKPDVTLSIIKNSKDEADQLQKVYYNENVYRISGSTKAFIYADSTNNSASQTSGTLVYTGAQSLVYVIPVLAVVAIASLIVIKKRS